MALSAAYATINCAQLLSACRPIAYNWDTSIPGGHCTSKEAAYLSSACINLAIDILIVALPMPVLWNLQLVTKKKIILSAIFGMGAL